MYQKTFKDIRPDIIAHRKYVSNAANRHPIALLLDGVSDWRNIGNIFRLADAALIRHVYFHNIPALDFDKRLKRVARNTEPYVPYSFVKNIESIRELKTQYQLIALEWTNESVPYQTFKSSVPLLLTIGNEKRGVSKEVLQEMSHSVHINMYGVNSSMNVTMATGIVVYDLMNKLI